MNQVMNDIWPILLGAIVSAIGLYVGVINRLCTEVKLLKEKIKQLEEKCKDVSKLLNSLRKYYTDEQIIIIVGFAAQMQATNNFNSVLGVDVDKRLLPLKDEFKPATWREVIK